MDFAKLDLRESASEEHWLQLRVGQTLLFAQSDKSKPCRIKVATAADPRVKAALKAVERAGRSVSEFERQLTTANRQQKVEIERRADDADAIAEKAIKQFLNVAVRGWENIFVKDDEVSFSPSALADLSEPQAPLFRLATTIAEDMGEIHNPFLKAKSV